MNTHWIYLRIGCPHGFISLHLNKLHFLFVTCMLIVCSKEKASRSYVHDRVNFKPKLKDFVNYTFHIIDCFNKNNVQIVPTYKQSQTWLKHTKQPSPSPNGHIMSYIKRWNLEEEAFAIGVGALSHSQIGLVSLTHPTHMVCFVTNLGSTLKNYELYDVKEHFISSWVSITCSLFLLIQTIF